MNPLKKTMLRRNVEKIVEDLEVEHIIDKLYSQLVINRDEFDKINAQSQRKIRTRCLLDIISHKNDEEYDTFVNILNEDYKWLAKDLKRDTDIGCVNEEEYQEQVYYDALTLGEVPQLPMHYVPRTSELKDIKEELKKLQRGKYVVLHGMTGSGKSVLAISAVRDKQLLSENFNDSMYFVNAGEAKQDMDIASVLYRLYIKLDTNYKRHSTTDIEFNKTGIHYMQNELRQIFSSDDKSQALLILDDVCSKSIIDAFNFGCKTLVTTRDLTVVPQQSSSLFDVSKGFKETESLKLFSQSVGLKIEELPSETRRIHVLCKGAPLLISLIASNAAKWKMEARKKERWNEYITMLIDKKDGRFEKVLQKFSRRKRGESPNDHTFNTIKHCLNDLSNTYQQFYKYFALFVEDVNITPRVLEIVLQKSKYEVEELVSELQNKSLLVCAYNSELKTYVYGIHDLLLSHLKQILSEEELVQYHKNLVTNYLKVSENDFAKLPNDNYIFTYIGYHLVEAKQYDVFPHLYFNLNFIGAKIKAVGIAGLVGDFVRYRKHITNDDNLELCEKLDMFQTFVQNYGQDLFKFPETDIIQCGLQQPEDSAVYKAAICIAQKQCAQTLYLQTKFFGQTRYVTNTLDLNEDVTASCFAHQTNTILVGTAEGQIHLYDHSFKSKLRTFTGHTGKILQLELFQDGSQFISVSEDGLVKIWSLEDAYMRRSGVAYDEYGLQLNTPPPSIYQKNWMSMYGDEERADHSKTYSVPNDNITCASLSDDYIVYGTENGKVQVRDLESGKEVFNVVRPNVRITCCILSLGDSLILFAYDNAILIYDFNTQEYVSQFMNDVRTTSLLVVPYCETKIIAISDSSVTIWSWVQPKQQRRIIISDIEKCVLDSRHDAIYICGAVTSDGAYLVAGLSDHYIRMWNIETKDSVTEMFEHNGLVISLDTFRDELSNSNVMYILLSGSDNKTVKQWHIQGIEGSKSTTKLLPKFTTHWTHNNLIPLIAAINSDHQIQVFNGHALISESRVLNHPNCLTFSPCGNSVAIGLNEGVVMLFDVRSKKSTNVMNLEGPVTYIEYFRNQNAKSGYILIAASDNTCLMAYNGEDSFRYKNPEINQVINTEIKKVIKNNNSKTIKCFSLFKINRILSVEVNGSVKLWNTRNLVDVLVVSDANFTVVMANISIKQDRIVLTYSNKEFAIYSLEAMADCKVDCELQHRSKLEDVPRCCTFSPCGHLLAFGLDSGSIVIWSVENNVQLSTLQVHTTWVRNLIFSPKPIEGGPLVLVSIGDQIAWWDVTYVWMECLKTKKRRDSRHRGLMRFSDPGALLIDVTPSAVLMDESWIGKKGPDRKRELLSVIKLSGGYGFHVTCSPSFTCFVTVDSSGILYIMNILQANPEEL